MGNFAQGSLHIGSAAAKKGGGLAAAAQSTPYSRKGVVLQHPRAGNAAQAA